MNKPMIALVLALFATVAHAQNVPAVDVAAGYSFLGVVKGFGLNLNGGSGSAALNANNWLAAVGDVGVYHCTQNGAGVTAGVFTAGPRFSYRRWKRFVPFAQALLGGAHATAAPGTFANGASAFAFGAGGGADIGLDSGGRYALRPQVEYFGFRASGTIDTVRASLGVVVRIGKKK